MQAITRQQAVERIYSSGSQIVGITFIKRSDGTVRTMSARLGVKAHLKGGQPAYDFKQHGLISVFDMNNGYRCIPIEGIVSITANGETYQIVDSPDNPLEVK